jgi:hypothetical protein
VQGRLSLPEDRAKPLIADGAFQPAFVNALFEYLVGKIEFRFARVNSSDQHGFPSLSSLFSRAQLLSNVYLKRLVETTVGLGGMSDQLALRRAQVNATLFGEMQYIHSDKDVDRTAIYFANPEWHPDWMGELLLYDEAETEVIEAISPKPGRIVFFDSLIRHRGGVPSRICPVPRVTIALKFIVGGRDR